MNKEILKIKYYSNRLMFYASICENLTLFYGKMGLIIYYMQCSQIMGSETYKKFAEDLMEDIYMDISSVSTLSFCNGLSGIAWGILYLIEHEYMTGNADIVLKDIDEIIISNCLEHKNVCIEDIYPYISYRLRLHTTYQKRKIYSFIVRKYKTNNTQNFSLNDFIMKNEYLLNDNFEKIGLRDGSAGALFKLCLHTQNNFGRKRL